MTSSHQARRIASVLVAALGKDGQWPRLRWFTAAWPVLLPTRGWPRGLNHRGHRALLVALPVDRPELTGTDYARLVAGQLDAALAQDGTHSQPVVVVAHSASGLLLPLVPSFRPVAHLVYLAAGVPQPGMTLDEQLEAEPDMLNPAWVGVDPFQDHQAARRFLFHDCDPETAGWAIATQTPWYPEGLYSERCPLAGFPPIPSTSIVCAADRVIQPAWSRRVASDRLRARVIELPGGHCPHLSRPELLAEALITTTSR